MGIIPRVVKALFLKRARMKKVNIEVYMVSFWSRQAFRVGSDVFVWQEYMEIYRDECFDLLVQRAGVSSSHPRPGHPPSDSFFHFERDTNSTSEQTTRARTSLLVSPRSSSLRQPSLTSSTLTPPPIGRRRPPNSTRSRLGAMRSSPLRSGRRRLRRGARVSDHRENVISRHCFVDESRLQSSPAASTSSILPVARITKSVAQSMSVTEG